MSVSVYIYLEVLIKGNWQVIENNNIPLDIAPQGWGKYNFKVYYEQSGEKDLPDDLSPKLSKWIDKEFSNEINRPSWMFVSEIIRFYESDKEQYYSHLNISWDNLSDFTGAYNIDTNSNSNLNNYQQLILKLEDNKLDDVRVVFWAN